MDPSANLREQLKLARRLVDGEEPDDNPVAVGAYAVDAARLAELVIALDEWIKGGGFLPAPWHR